MIQLFLRIFIGLWTLLYPITLWAAPPVFITSLQRLAELAKSTQNIERSLREALEEIDLLEGHEQKKTAEVFRHHQQMFATLHHFRHLEQYSPVLTTLTALSPDDLIHTHLLLRSVLPELKKKNQLYLDLLLSLVKLRIDLHNKRSDYVRVVEHHSNNLAEIEKTYRQKVKAISGLPSVNSWEFSKFLRENLGEKTLIAVVKPVDGKRLELEKDQNLSQEFVLFETKSSALVVSPITGVVESAGNNQIIFQAGEYHIDLKGLGPVNCTQGQFVIAGEPIGQMPGSFRDNTQQILQVSVWNKGQQVDPSIFF